MKIRSIIVAIIAVAAIAVVGCQKDPLVDTTEITTKQVTSITGWSAVSGGEVTSDGTPTISKRGVCWSTSPEPTMNDYTVTHHNGGLGKFSVTMDGLSENTTYYVRAFAWNSTGAIYGEEYSFTTPYKPTLSTLEVEDVTSVSAVCGGNITDDGNATITQRGLCWSTHENPTIEDSTSVVDSVDIGTFKSEMTKLTPGTLYYVRAYATNAAGTTYGEELSFTTLNVPVLKATEIANVTQETVVCSGSILDNAGADVTEQGFCWSTTPQPTTENEKITATAENGLGDFSITISGLQWGTTYYVRSYAIHAAGTSYGEETSFVTWKMATKNITDITVMSAVCGGTIEPLDAKGISEKGLCWSKISNPTIENEKIVSNGGTNNFSETISGLDEGETYYVRAYAINAVGTFYGEERIFTTLTVPTVETYNAEDVSYTTATAKAKVVADGGATVTERGFCYSTSNTNPTLSDGKITVGNGTGNFNYSFTGLTDNTTYYIRSYATNSVGTAYGNTINFTTIEITAPTVAATTATNVSYTSVTLGGNITNDNGATVTERGVCYSTSTNPTISNSKKDVGSGTGSFSIKITELNKNVTYYARAYAINSKGTSYGSVVSFTTTLVGAIQGEFSVSATKKVYFSQGNLQYQASTSIWRFAENQYDVIGRDNTNISSTYSGWIDLFGWGTSGWNSGANAYQPYSTSESYSDYYPGGDYTNNLTGSYANADWGVYNKISNGGNSAGKWRTLTNSEWNYVISNRTDARYLRGTATVNGVNGLILLPDNWTLPTGVTFTYGEG
ncbi:MAG: hypothetical protein IKJ56_08520, partial [Bacteroidales bacterium]|nr:hypothetical protein [Bacteroidales bacterium]